MIIMKAPDGMDGFFKKKPKLNIKDLFNSLKMMPNLLTHMMMPQEPLPGTTGKNCFLMMMPNY